MSILIKGIDMPKKHHADGYYIYDDGTVRNLDRNRKLGEAVQYNDPEQRWIPCSERLPKENGKYIVSLEDSVYPEASFFNGKWFMRSLNGIAREFGEYEVIAWMPLPEPYKGETDGEAK